MHDKRSAAQPRVSTCFGATWRDALVGDKWVLDGNYTRTIPIKWERVQIVIWLDYPFFMTLIRALRRATTRALTKSELWEGTGNRESLRRSLFSKDSIIWWTIKTHRQVRRRYEQLMADPAYRRIKFVRIRDQGECDKFLSTFGGSSSWSVLH